MARQPRTPRGQRRRQKGVAALETALSLLVVSGVLVAAISFGDAMVVRQRLTGATTSAARICALQAPNAVEGCMTQQVQVYMAGLANRCALDSESSLRNLNGIQIAEIQVTCQYNWGLLSARLDSDGIDRPQLRARAAMPVQQSP